MASKPSKKTRDRKKNNAYLKDASRGIRLQKALASAGIASRRQCEELIANGHIRVNGNVVIELPAWVDPDHDVIELDHQEIDISSAEKKIYIAVYKPRGVICTNNDPEKRRNIIDLVPHEQALHCVGRLDSDSHGLVLLTNDGELTQKLTHPRFGVPKTYLVTISGRLVSEDIEKLQKGIWLADKTGEAFKVQSSTVSIERKSGDTTQLKIILHEGRNREIRRMLARLGYKVKKLQRIAIGPLSIKGLKSGKWRELSKKEIIDLRKATQKSTRNQKAARPRKTTPTNNRPTNKSKDARKPFGKKTSKKTTRKTRASSSSSTRKKQSR